MKTKKKTAKAGRSTAKTTAKSKGAAKRASAKPAAKKGVSAKKSAKPAKPAKRASAKVAKRAAAKPAKRAPAKKAASAKVDTGGGGAGRWVKFVEKNGVVLASARGPLPSVAEAVAGEPIVGSWWAHPKGHDIFSALSEIDDSPDIRCFKLVDGKVTFAHRKTWPALVRLGRDGVIAAEQLGSVQQEHMPTGEHRNFVHPFPDWVDDETGAAADALSTDQARATLAWLDA